jgi:dihydroorotase
VDEGLLNLSQAIASITQQPAAILGRNSSLAVGECADVCIFDPQEYWQLTSETMLSQGHNSPFLGWEFKGRVTHTLLAGHVSFGAKS